MIIEQNNSEIITGRRVHTFFFFRFLIFSFSHFPFIFYGLTGTYE